MSRPVSHGTLYSFVWRQRDRGGIPCATNRDLRRTFKTLAGKAGVSKEIRDRLQNHALQDVSSKNYDHWHYMPEKRAGMAKWDKCVRAMLASKRDEDGGMNLSEAESCQVRHLLLIPEEAAPLFRDNAAPP